MLRSSSYNPDVLSCIANLSSDEVVTPPQLANRMLDLLPNELWSDRNATFLDPAYKSGVFLREIAKRLEVGLEAEISDRHTLTDRPVGPPRLAPIAVTPHAVQREPKIRGVLERRFPVDGTRRSG